MNIKIIYEDKDVLVVDKPAGIVVFPENAGQGATLIDILLGKFPKLKEVGQPPRHGIVHRLDKDTSGVLLVAKTDKALIFLQNQFKQRVVGKKYLALVNGRIEPAEGKIETLLGRAPKDRKKQRVYGAVSPEAKRKGLRQAVTEYRVLERFGDYTLLQVAPKTGRKHQIRAHLAHLGYPIAGDRMYGFKNQPCPEGLKRQFLHASYLKIKLPSGETKEFCSDLPEDLNKYVQ